MSRKKKAETTADPLAERLRVHHEGWVIGMCEGAAAWRKALQRKLAQPDATGDDVFAFIGEVDDEFRRRFPKDYDHQLQIRTKDD